MPCSIYSFKWPFTGGCSGTADQVWCRPLNSRGWVGSLRFLPLVGFNELRVLGWGWFISYGSNGRTGSGRLLCMGPVRQCGQGTTHMVLLDGVVASGMAQAGAARPMQLGLGGYRAGRYERLVTYELLSYCLLMWVCSGRHSRHLADWHGIVHQVVEVDIGWNKVFPSS